MKLGLLPLFCLRSAWVQVVQGECAEFADDRPEGCYDEPRIAKIVCTGYNPCVCTAGREGDTCTEIVPANALVNVTSAEMDGEKCRDICEASKTVEEISNKCEYFRWEEVGRLLTILVIA